jgi:hypothetical protein
MRDPTLLGSVPLHLGAFQRTQDEALLDWFRAWMGLPKGALPLNPEEWMVEGHGLTSKGDDSALIWTPTESSCRSFLWAPAPGAADVAIEELRKARHKRPHLFHAFVCPRLMAPRWRHGVCREADFQFEIPVGSKLWPASSHEPLSVAVFLPFIKHRPWQLKNTPKLL